MKLGIFAVHDSKVGAYLPPYLFLRSPGEAIRGFEDAVNDGKSMMSKYPGDYHLVQLGEFDDAVGALLAQPHPVTLCNALDVKKVEPTPMFPRGATPSAQ